MTFEEWEAKRKMKKAAKKATKKSKKAGGSYISGAGSDGTYAKAPDGGNHGGPIVGGVERCSPTNDTPRYSIYDPSNSGTNQKQD